MFDPPKSQRKQDLIGSEKSPSGAQIKQKALGGRRRRKVYGKALVLQLAEVGYAHSLEEGGGRCTHFAIDGDGQKTAFSSFTKHGKEGMPWKRVWEDMNKVFPDTKGWPFGEQIQVSSKPKAKANIGRKSEREPEPSGIAPIWPINNRYELLKKEDLPSGFKRKTPGPRRRKNSKKK